MFHSKRIAAAVLPALALTTGAALAECPTSIADTTDSIYVTFNDFHVRYELLSDGTVMEEETNFDDGSGFRVNSLRGAYVLQSWSTQNGMIVPQTGEATTWAVGPVNLPVLSAGQSWSGSTVRLHDDGARAVETVTVATQAARQTMIGTCAYESWPMVVTTSPDDGTADYIDYLTYLPSLGIAIYHGGIQEGEPFTRDEPTSISTEPPLQGETGYLLDGAAPMPGNPTPAAPPGQPDPNK
ncbi:hypothetical protein [Alterinioella nitratireducens]|uniref:hypothetical protein n=1 Tax=Alterinioella nitratireducens TaxID=2735915 RepID=UPI004058BB76